MGRSGFDISNPGGQVHIQLQRMDSKNLPLLWQPQLSQTNFSAISNKNMSMRAAYMGGAESGMMAMSQDELLNMPIAPIDIMRALPFGKFHMILIAIHLILYISSSFTIYNMGFLQMIPAYQCSMPQTGNSSLLSY